jgi:hypothetical protein
LSEYQYYEFLAVDRPLDKRAQAEVRSLSTRARITATSFVNEYHWGDFSGNSSKMMERYYDAHLYLANWGTRHIMLRLPRSLFDLDVAGQYCIGDEVTAWTAGKHLILSLASQAEEESWDYEPQGSLASIVGVRGELSAGDHRALYLAWLAGYGTWERDESDFDDEDNDEPEPPVPAGLRTLTAPQRALADFLRLDDDLLAVAAEASPPLGKATASARNGSAARPCDELRNKPAEVVQPDRWQPGLPGQEHEVLGHVSRMEWAAVFLGEGFIVSSLLIVRRTIGIRGPRRVGSGRPRWPWRVGRPSIWRAGQLPRIWRERG